MLPSFVSKNKKRMLAFAAIRLDCLRITDFFSRVINCNKKKRR